MKLGMPTLIEFDSLEDNMKLCKSLELDVLELNMNLPIYNTDMDVDVIKSLKEKYSIELTLHAHENLDIGEFDSNIRCGYFKAFKDIIKIGKQLDISLINMHLSMGIHFTLPDGKVYLFEAYESEYISNINRFKQFVEKEIGGSDIKISIENTGIHDNDFIRKATDLLLESESFCLTYDIGHDITSGFKDKEYFLKHIDRIEHFHIHDGTNEKNHLELFTGNLDIVQYIQLSKSKNARCIIEVKESESLINSIKKLNEKNCFER